MVAAPHPLAAEAGMAVLREGGTAMDAAVAANAVLTVVYPDQTAIGGDCFLLYHEAATGQTHAYNGSGRAPLAADRDALGATHGGRMPRQGIATVTVPGTVDAWDAALDRFGRLGLDRALRPAIALARDGFPVSPRLSAAIAAMPPTLVDNPALQAIFLPAGVVPSPDSLLPLPDLAASLELIAREGRAAFYDGALAEAIGATSERLGGALAAGDLTAHRGEWVDPIAATYRGLTVLGFPPNSQGLTALLALNLIERERPAPWGSTDGLHAQIEAKKLAFAVRDRTLADPAFVPQDPARLVSKTYAADLWRAYDPGRAAAGAPSLAGDTVYLCAVDRDGNAASLIQSLFQAFGSGVVADGTGIVLQNRGTSFSLAADHPNRLEPGKRPMHTLMPAMLLRDGALLGPLGTQGGDAQAQVHLQLIAAIADHGLHPQQAVDAPRWLAGGLATDPPTLVSLEAGFPAGTVAGLAARNHTVRQVPARNPHFGHAQVILRDSARGVLLGGADPRADGSAVGY